MIKLKINLCRPEDSEYEVANMKPGIGELEVFPTIWGHWAGGPGDSKDDVQWLDEQLSVFFVKNEIDKLRTGTYQTAKANE